MITVDFYKIDYRNDIISLLEIHWSKCNFQKAERYFCWRYEKNPYTIEPLIVVARHNNKIIGVRPFVVQLFTEEDRNILVASGADAFVLPEFRGEGVFHLMNKVSFDYLKEAGICLIINISSNKITRHANLKAGWRNHGNRKIWYFLFKFSSFIKNRIKTRHNDKQDYKYMIRNREIPFEDIIAINGEIDKYRVKNLRDIRFYGWRYLQPEIQYFFSGAYRYGKLKAYLIYTVRKHQIVVVEYYTHCSIVLKQLVTCSLKEHNLILARIDDYSLNENDSLLLKKSGFFEEPMILVKLFNFNRGGVLAKSLCNIESVNALRIKNLLIQRTDVH